MEHRAVDAERNTWEGLACEGGSKPHPTGAMTPEAYQTIVQSFEALAQAEPDGRPYPTCPLNRYHKFSVRGTSDAQPLWVTCAGPKDDLTGLDEPFVTIAKVFLGR